MPLPVRAWKLLDSSIGRVQWRALSNFGKLDEARMHQIETKLAIDESVWETEPIFRTVSTCDADELARNLSGWQQSYDQISAGRFQGTLDELCLPRMQVFRETINQAVRQSCRVLPGSLWFGFPDHSDRLHRSDQVDGNRINGRKVAPELIMLHSGSSEFELLTGSAHAIFGIVVCQQWLMAQAGSDCQIDWQGLQSGEVLQTDPSARAACINAIKALLACTHQQHELAADLQNRLVHNLLALLGQGDVLPAEAGSFQRRQRIVARVRDHVLGHLDQAITVPQMCEQAHVSRRTLQYCFEDIVGMSPTQYLRRVRLNGVRRQLRYPQSGREAIGAVASDWGFDNFSQFSSDYRKLFGACASESMM
jgi:AraC family ethanolamine operon transcriptional activator